MDRWSRENESETAWRDRKWLEIAAKAQPELIIDEVTIGSRPNLSGTGWQAADGNGAFGGGVFWSEARKGSEPERAATWRPDNPLLDRYRVSVWYGALANGGAATDAPFTIITRKGEQRFALDQSRQSGAWRELGVFNDPLHVRLSNSANGRVIVDAVKFERLG